MNWVFRSDQPIYSQLASRLSEAIVAGLYRPGQRLPSVRDIALDAGVNPNTVQRALSELERTELVFAQRTAGRYVTEDEEKIRQAKLAMAREKGLEFWKAMQTLGVSHPEAIALLEEIKEEHP